jgi:hypothetical protein
MTCGNCDHDWCWHCRGSYWSHEIACSKLLPCRGDDENRCTKCCKLLTIAITGLICSPLLLLLVPLIGIPIALMIAFYEWYEDNDINILCCCCLIPFVLILAITLGALGGGLIYGFGIVPILIFYLFKICKACNVYSRCNVCWPFFCCI